MNICMLVKAAFWVCRKISIFFFLNLPHSAVLSDHSHGLYWLVLHRECCVVQKGAYGRTYKNCTNRYVILIGIQALYWQTLKWLVCDKLWCLIEVIFFLLVCMPCFCVCLRSMEISMDHLCLSADTSLIELLLFVPFTEMSVLEVLERGD